MAALVRADSYTGGVTRRRRSDDPRAVQGDLHPVSWTAHLDDARYDALRCGEMELCVTVRPAFRSVTVALFAGDGERFLPAGTDVRRVALYILP